MSESGAGSVRAGMRATFVGTVLTGLLQFGFMAVLARLLSPAQYGAYALCVAITSLSATFLNNVAERSLVVDDAEQGEAGDPSTVILLLTAATTSVAIAVAAGLQALGAWAVDVPLLGLTLLGAVVASIAIVPRVWLRRRMSFDHIVRAELAGLVIGTGLVTIILAEFGWGSYALAAGSVAQSLVLVMMLRTHAREMPRERMTSMTSSARLVRSALGISRTAAAEIVNGQVAPMVLATQLGVIPVGLFNRTYSLVQMPIQLLAGSMSRVMISALFAMREDLPRFRKSACALVRIAGVVLAPVAAGIAGTNRTFILLAFGRKWIAAETFLPLLALSGWAVMMGTLFGITLEAQRAFDTKTRTQVTSTIVLVTLALAGTRWGLTAAVAGIAIGSCVYLLMTARAAAQLVGMPTTRALAWLAPGLVLAAPCFATAWAIGQWVDLPTPALFALQVAGCAIVDTAGLLLLYPSVALQLIEGAAPVVLRRSPRLARHLRTRTVRVET